MSNSTKISVLICTRNRPQDITWSLPAVLANDYPNFEVVLVDQSDGKETSQIVAEMPKDGPALVYIPAETRGKSLALNIGVKACTGEIIACTDDDTEMDSHWVSDVAKLFESDPKLDMTFGQVHLPKDVPPDSAVPSLYFDKYRILKLGDIFGMGANMAFRRDLYVKLDGYDDMLGPGAPLACSEDFDFTYRAQRIGAKVTAEPSLILVHRAHRTRDEWKKVMYAYGVGDAAFYLKHARCGDFWATREYVGKLLYSVARRIFGRPFGKGRGHDTYLQGLWEGIGKSWQYDVDRVQRLYHIPASATNPAGSKAIAKTH